MSDVLSTKELALATAGGDSFIRTYDGEVKGLALRLDLNPEAPEFIVVGHGPRKVSNALLFAKSGKAVPAYIKRDVNKWEYMGHYRAKAYLQDKDTINRYRHNRLAESINGILFLESADEVSVSVHGGGFPDSQTRQEAELAAVLHVMQHLEAQGYEIEDMQKENCGYDLLAKSKNNILKVEVKGTANNTPRFFLSRNERQKSSDPAWRLALVSNATTKPILRIMNTIEMERDFNFDALAWECLENGS